MTMTGPTNVRKTITGQWFSPEVQVSSTNKTDHHDIIEILLKLALSTIKTKPNLTLMFEPLHAVSHQTLQN
jgi:hypothetical protein